MFPYEGMKSNMTCALKVDTNCKGWYETTTKILRKIKGVSYNLDAKEGMIYISGKVDPQKILRRIAKHGKKVELCWMQTGEQYGSGANNIYGMDHIGTSTPMPISAYPPYNRGFCPPPPMPYYQYNNYEPVYPSQMPYYY